MLTEEGLDRLLALLDSDREQAADRYEILRQRLQKLFRWWGADQPLELADVTLDRVAGKLEDGAHVPPQSIHAYVRAVARMVHHEALREREREAKTFRDAVTLGIAAPNDIDPSQERALTLLEECLQTLTPPDRDLILGYYGGDESRIAARFRIAGALGLSSTALRIRAHRLRQRLERCLSASIERLR